MRLPGAGRLERHDRPAGLLRGTLEGLAFVWRDRLLRTISALTAVLTAIYLPIEGVLLPVYFERQGAPQQLGAVLMAISAGAVIGTLGYGQWGHRWSRRTVLVTAVVACGVALVGMSVLPPLPLLVGFAGLVGLSYGPVQPMVNLAMQTRAPLRLRGRVIGVLSATEHSAGPLGYLLAGPAINAFGVRRTFIGLAVALLLAALATLPLRTLRELDTLPEVPLEH